jgi:FkbM family methyltransferase
MGNYKNNQQRTEDYLKIFDREKTLKVLIKEARPVIFDVGANVGATFDDFKLWWPDSAVHCFEPQQECWASLEQRVGRYPASEAVLNKVAAGNTSSDAATFFVHDINSGVSGFNKINLQSEDSIHLRNLMESDGQALRNYEQSLNHARSVKVIRLDEYMTEGRVDRINLLKIDTQGYEPEVLEGLGEKLSDVDVVITELMFYDYYERRLSFSDIEKFLLPAGLRLYDINHISKNPMNGRTDWVDVIYVNDRVRSRE